MFKRIDHVEIVPADFDRSLQFYSGILGFRERERIPIVGHPTLREVAYLDLGDTTLELLRYDSPESRPSHTPQVGYRMMAIEVDSMDDAISYLAGKGIRPSEAPIDAGGSFRAEITDPDGLSIELRQW